MMKSKASSALYPILRTLAFGLLALPTWLTQAATLWTGPLITFTQPGTNPTQPANQDRLTDAVWITRGASMGIFNAVTETGYTHDLSPANTEWAYGPLANYATLTYAPWEIWHAKNPPSMVGTQAVLHLISEDIYLSIKFTAWGGILGGFAYERSTPAPAAPTLTAPQLNQNSFTFTASTTAGLTYVMESSSNLVHWVAQSTNVAAGNTLHFTNSFLPNQSRFYRVGQRANP